MYGNGCPMPFHYGNDVCVEQEAWHQPASSAPSSFKGYVLAQIPYHPILCFAVSINGNDIRTLQSSSVSADGWFTSASNKTPNAPFDVPFYMILWVPRSGGEGRPET